MGLFNSLFTKLACPSCQHEEERELQFRYGNVWLHKYVIGSPLIWDSVAVGEPGPGEVVVDAWLDDCSKCGFEGRHALFIRDNIIYGVGPIGWVPDLPDSGWVARPQET